MQSAFGQRINYFLYSAYKLAKRQGLVCPSCGCPDSQLVARKYLVTALRRCSACRLLFRTPTTSVIENEKFYQREYQQGFTTELPTPDELRRLKSTMFKNTEKDYTTYISVLRALDVEPGARLLDYGCSWGYGSWQLFMAGFSVQAYEISRTRCEYARNELQVDATWDVEELKRPIHVFFSCHVLEHVPSVKEVIALAETLLTQDGYFIAFTPNGSEDYRKNNPWHWQRAWGLVHPNMLDVEYWRSTFRDTSFFIRSSAYDCNAITTWKYHADQGVQQNVGGLSGNELLCIAKIR